MEFPSNDFLLMKERVRNRPRVIMDRGITSSEFICSNCGLECEDYYFICTFHKQIFCEDCIKNFGFKEIDRTNAPRCKRRMGDKQKWVERDCIYQKIRITEK